VSDAPRMNLQTACSAAFPKVPSITQELARPLSHTRGRPFFLLWTCRKKRTITALPRVPEWVRTTLGAMTMVALNPPPSVLKITLHALLQGVQSCPRPPLPLPLPPHRHGIARSVRS
jgi:hypothetical protein